MKLAKRIRCCTDDRELLADFALSLLERGYRDVGREIPLYVGEFSLREKEDGRLLLIWTEVDSEALRDADPIRFCHLRLDRAGVAHSYDPVARVTACGLSGLSLVGDSGSVLVGGKRRIRRPKCQTCRRRKGLSK